MIMKRLIAVLVSVLIVVGGAYATGETIPPKSTGDTIVDTVVDIDSTIDVQQVQEVSVVGGNATSIAGGGSADSDSSASASVNTSTNYETRTAVPPVFPPYLPYWNHGGWGTIKAYFPNGPNNDDAVYERVFDPDNPSDMNELKGVLKSLSYDGPLGVLGGILNCVGTVFGGPDNYHHGRGFEIANSLVRDRRPRGKPLLVFIDSNVDTNLLRKADYAYVGNISLEGKVNRNWDQVYDAAVAEALPWDVDVLLITGGMKGVTVGSNIAFPGASGAYSQVNHAVSLFGAVSSGITEGKGKAVVSAAGYRLWPELANRRRIPQAFYNSIQASLRPARRLSQRTVETTQRAPSTTRRKGVRREEIVQEVPSTTRQQRVHAAEVAQKAPSATRKKNVCGVEVSRRLWELAGFDEHQTVQNVVIK
jgi:hypothetical protein